MMVAEFGTCTNCGAEIFETQSGSWLHSETGLRMCGIAEPLLWGDPTSDPVGDVEKAAAEARGGSELERWADSLDEIAHQSEGLSDWQEALDGAVRILRQLVNRGPQPETSREISARARRTDPDTSHEAAESVTNLTAKQEAVLRLLDEYGPLTDENMLLTYEIVWRNGRTEEFPKQSESGLRTRRSELVKKGKVVDSGQRAKLSTGRRGIVWQSASSPLSFTQGSE